jgi:hypothetical protein
MIHTVFGILLTITGFFDAIKYAWEAKKIREVGTARGHSRKFINAAIINDVVRIVYFVLISKDWYLIISAGIAIFCMFYQFWTIYIYYPYRYRGLQNFKRPSLYVFILNSLIPNKYRRRL